MPLEPPGVAGDVGRRPSLPSSAISYCVTLNKLFKLSEPPFPHL